MEGEPEVHDLERIEETSIVKDVLLADLQVDRSYQRDPSQGLVDKIAEDFDSVSAELLLISNRGKRPADSEVKGGLWIVNGQHRMIAGKKIGKVKMKAMILDLSEYDDPASTEASFRLRTNVRNPDKAIERFKAQLRAGNPESVAIERIVASFDSEINFVPNVDSGINSVTSLERLYRVDEGELLTATFQLIRDAYGYVGGKHASANLIVGCAWFLSKHAEEADRARVIEKLASVGPVALERTARNIAASQPGTMWMHTYRAIVTFYNERLQPSNMLEWRLRGSSSFKTLGGSVATTYGK